MEETRPLVTRMEVAPCLLCNQSHEVDVKRYNQRGTGKSHPFYTHWYTCPVTQDPVGFTLKMDAVEPWPEKVVRQFAEAFRGGRWMTYICRQHDGEVSAVRERHNFNSSDYDWVASDLAQMLRNEVAGPAVSVLEPAELPARKPLFRTLSADDVANDDEVVEGDEG